MKPALVLDDSCYQDRDFSLSLLGKVKEFSSLSNLKMAKENFLSHVGAGSWFSSLQQPSNSFHTDERIAWIDIEGVSIMAWKRVCIKTKMVENIFESFKIIVKGKVYWTRVKEVTGWNPDFMEEDDTQTESENATIQSESDEERIPKLCLRMRKTPLMKRNLKIKSRKQQHLDHKAGEVVIMGDFNEVHTQDERFGSIFNIQGAAIFNSFISSSGLVDVPMGRCSFTWVHKSAAKMSKLDRFLISEVDLEQDVFFRRTKKGQFGNCGNGINLQADGSTFVFIEDIGVSMFKGVSIGSNLHLSHLFYADDVVFLRQWHFFYFEKAFDSVRWDYLDEVLKKFGFGDRWCGWIHSCLRSSRGSILVNGSPTKEFQFHKGLKQGDPLSPFLFILIMESLHLSFQNVVNAGMFKGVSIGSNLHLSHLFYADDVVFLGQWSNSNISTIIKVLKCFFCASGLSINMHKSKLMGIAVDDDIVNQAAHSIGCLQLKSPFSYLGSRIGGSMSRINSWDDIVNKLLARLSKWKMKTLSIGGRLTLLKSVLGSTPIYYMSLFKVPSQVLKRMESIRSRFFNGVDIMEKKLSFVSWNKVLASKNKGGLGVSSFFAMNRALMFKWVWRFKTDSTSLWAKFILAMHGKDGNLSTTAKSSFPSIWLDIIRELHNLKNKGIDLLGFIKKKIGNGVDTLFWEDTWKGDIAFKFLYPRIYKLETCKQINVASKLVHDNVRLSLRRMPRGGVELEQFTDMINSLADFQLPNMQDRWYWSLSGSGDFSVASVRKIIDDHLLPEVSSKFSWRKMVPIKVNILAWKVKLDVLPTRFNLSKRGLDINSILCPICENHAESSSHLFFACSMARDIFRNITSWWDVKSPHVSSFEEWEMWTSSLTLSLRRKHILEGIIYIGWWSIWNFKNQVVFGSTIPSKASLFDDIVARSFQWCKHRGKFKFSLIDWLKNSYLVNI
ncbi:RNA-directed DNA polymerase, eukaryota, reverse transcriptase zinc-binding domain protein [Tanacetum coccineum]